MQENQVDLQLQIECVLRLPPVPVSDPVSRCGSRKSCDLQRQPRQAGARRIERLAGLFAWSCKHGLYAA